jgi:hypothetical protein
LARLSERRKAVARSRRRPSPEDML